MGSNFADLMLNFVISSIPIGWCIDYIDLEIGGGLQLTEYSGIN